MIRSLFHGMGRDVGEALHGLARHSTTTTGVVFSLVLGLGVNITVFQLLNRIYLEPPAGISDAGHVRRVWAVVHFSSGPQFWSGFSYPQFAAIASAVDGRASAAVYHLPEKASFESAGHSAEMRVSRASSSYFSLIGVRPAVGRFYDAAEDRLGAPADVIVCSYAFWQHYLGGDLSALGQRIDIGPTAYTLIGIAGRGFSGAELDATDCWLPLATTPPLRPGTSWWLSQDVNGFQVLLRPRRAAHDDDAVLASRIATGLHSPAALARAADSSSAVELGSIIRARGPGKQSGEDTIALRLAGATILILLIACANATILLLVRATRRRRDIAIRLAVGISRYRLTRLLFVESIALAVLAAVAATVAARWSEVALRRLLLPTTAWTSGSPTMNWHVLAFAFGLALVAGVGAGIMPVGELLGLDLVAALKGVEPKRSMNRGRARSILVAMQVALSVALIAGARALVQSLGNVREAGTGFDVPQLVLGTVRFESRDTLRDRTVPQAFRDIADRMRGLGGVEAVALAQLTPTKSIGVLPIYLDRDTAKARLPFASFNVVSPEYFAASGTRLLRGPGFARGGEGRPTVVINEAFARTVWPDSEPLGRCLRFTPDGDCYRVSGVVENSLLGKLGESPQPQYFLPLDDAPASVGGRVSTIIVRVHPTRRAAIVGETRGALRAAFPAGTISVSTLEDLLEPQFAPWKAAAQLFAELALVALVLSVIGIYSTVAYSVSQQRHEFGIRRALGAQARDIVLPVLRSSLTGVTFGACLGIVLALVGLRSMAALLYGVSAQDLAPILASIMVMLIASVGGAIGPALSASRSDPLDALRRQ